MSVTRLLYKSFGHTLLYESENIEKLNFKIREINVTV